MRYLAVVHIIGWLFLALAGAAIVPTLIALPMIRSQPDKPLD
jgi:hypothetical protein